MSRSFRYFGGVDFSGAREPLSNLWTALAREEDGRPRVVSLRPHAFRQDLAAFVGEGWRGAVTHEAEVAILWGVDFACGLPALAARELVGEGDWGDALAWVADRPADEVRETIPEEKRGPRLTDAAAGSSPFDTRSYKQTVEGLRWLHELREGHGVTVTPQQDATSARTLLVEVSPALTTIDLGLPRRRAPSRPGEHRARAAALRTFVTFDDPELECLAVTLEDAWDATLSCLTAWLVREDLDQPLRAGDPARKAMAMEGWIYRAPAALG